MASPRYNQISLEETKWYHVVSRCVRRAYLCGSDQSTGQSYAHRRDWVEHRVKFLATVFTIDIAAYAIMHNHYHLVVRVDDERVLDLSNEEVISRWTVLYKGPILVQRYMSDLRKEMSAGELLQVDKLAAVYRERLCDLSWFMKNLNHYIACRANAEDQAKGHFWESRYKCQALLDEPAVLAAMAYTDLNPIRAGIADELEASEYTSVNQRIAELKHAAFQADKEKSHGRSSGGEIKAGGSLLSGEKVIELNAERQAPLLPFDPIEVCRTSISFAFEDYLELLEVASRAVHHCKRGVVSENTPRLLQKYNIGLPAFIEHSNRFIECFGNHAGSPQIMTNLAAKRNARYLRGISKSRSLFGCLNEVA